MIKKIYSIRDAKSEVYNLPFYKTTHGEAERDFQTMANDEKTTINAYPEDFDLFYLGEYDDNLGGFKPLKTPQHVAKALHCIKKQNVAPLSADGNSSI